MEMDNIPRRGIGHEEQFPNLKDLLRNGIRNTFRWNTITKRLPILKWLPNYELRSYLFPDFVAGITVGLTAIPQSIAYGVVAGLGPEYGLYSAFMGCFIYTIFGSCKDITVGPTAIMALMVQQYALKSPDYAVLACFISGIIITLCGIINLGFLIQFISVPVTAGFTTAAAITIASGQINSLLGIKSSSNDFIKSWEHLFKNISQTKLNDSLLGILTLINLLVLRQVKDLPGRYKVIGKYISLSRNALAVIIGTLLAFTLSSDGYEPFRLTGKVEAGLPPFEPPPFSTNINGTHIPFSEMIFQLGSSLITIPLIAILESIAIAKAFSKGKIINASQEMIALGMCNVMGSFVCSMPVTGSFTRTAVNNASGVQTPLGGVLTGCLVLLALAFLTKTFYYIPKATLAAIIISAMIFMIEHKKISTIWTAKRIDIIPFILTLVACLFLGLEYGILIGVLVNLTFILYKSARPEMEISKEKIDGVEVLLVKIHHGLLYSSGEFIKQQILKHVMKSNKSIKYAFIQGNEICSIDSTVALNFLSACEDLKLLNCDIIFWNWNNEAANVILRLNKEKSQFFKNANSIEDIVRTDFVHNHLP